MNNVDYTTMGALESEEGIQVCCPTTGLYYTPLHMWFDAIAGQRVVHSYCHWCDTYRRTRFDADFDAAHPQPHMHLLSAAKDL